MSEQEHRGRAVSERIIRQLRETMTIDRVYGAPIERARTTVVPVASVRIGGGGGGGGGTDGNDSGSGEGGGFGAAGTLDGGPGIWLQLVGFATWLIWSATASIRLIREPLT